MNAAPDIHSASTRAFLSEEATAELWERGNLSWKLRPEQKLLKAGLEQDVVQMGVLNICRRFGKTYTLVVYVNEQAIKERQKIRYGCAFLTDLEEFVLPAFAIILEDCPAHLRPVYNRSRKTWTYPSTGSEVKLVGLDKHPNGLRGNAIAKMIIDEAGYVANLRFIYTSVIIPATAKQKDIKIIFMSTPPPSPDHFFVELIDKAQVKGNGFYLELTIDAISDLVPEERQRLLDEVGGIESVEAQREFFCKVIIDQSIALAPEFNQALHVRPANLDLEFCHWWVSGDTGGLRDRTVFHLLTYDFRRAKIIVAREVEYPHDTGSEVWVAAVKAMEAGRKVSRHVDCPGQLQVDLMGFHAFPCSLPRKDELEATVNQVRIALRRGEVEIDPSCKLLIKTLKGGTLNKQRTDLARTDSLGHMDAFMSFAYGLRHANKANPYPAYHGASPYTHYIRPTEQNPTAKGLRGILKGPK